MEPHWLEVVDRPLSIPGLSKELLGARLIYVSDVHVDPSVSDDYVVETFRRIAALEPDLLLVGGDFASSLREDVSHCMRIYDKSPQGRLGSFGVLGNHDYGRDWSNERAAGRLADSLRDCGIRILRNEHVVVKGLQIVGFDDLWAGRFGPVRALRTVRRDLRMIGLSHNPDTVDHGGWEGFRGHILSGHTHGGQCRPPFLPPPFLPVENRRYTAGEFDLPEDRTLYISRGVGHIFQARFLVRPEVTVFTLSG